MGCGCGCGWGVGGGGWGVGCGVWGWGWGVGCGCGYGYGCGCVCTGPNPCPFIHCTCSAFFAFFVSQLPRCCVLFRPLCVVRLCLKRLQSPEEGTSRPSTATTLRCASRTATETQSIKLCCRWGLMRWRRSPHGAACTSPPCTGFIRPPPFWRKCRRHSLPLPPPPTHTGAGEHPPSWAARAFAVTASPQPCPTASVGARTCVHGNGTLEPARRVSQPAATTLHAHGHVNKGTSYIKYRVTSVVGGGWVGKRGRDER